ncbi:D-galacturonate [Cyphellophora attinorum]|uniref:D-xylose reductase [NAD(P)H] n=1 Tax=Cyphellophora attinorum TaxID=1664694 RepID=A0A0N1HJY1_9EURO|nr:D-galacturonate [Phialophora attinorum]KPI36943.1 D-galacturonate [Phialophora attinorum]
MADTKFKLNTGAEIPALGLGTWQSPKGEVQKAVAHAIKSGYRHIDCAYAYGNEDEVGAGIKEGLKAAGISRSDLFVTTKLWCTYHTRVEQNLDSSLKALDLDYVDLYLMHWPVAMNPNGNDEKFPKLPDGSRDLVLERKHWDTYKDMEKLLSTGKVKAIGVSNYSVKFLKDLLARVETVPAANQVENHPLCSPLMQDEHVTKLAKEKGVSPGCILLSYHVARGIAPLPKSVTPSRIDENRQIVKLSPEDVQTLSDLSKNGVHRFVYPAFGVDFGFPDKQ